LILAEELQFPHVISVIDTKEEWYYKVHPERYVPALKDQDPVTKQEVFVFESTACLQYLAERFDTEGYWAGRNVWERAQVLSWTAYQTAGLGHVSCTTCYENADISKSNCQILALFLKGLP
jgi:glutathione S-transferase